ncbi:MAG TPA: hypothetical protein PLL20_20370 [Phycisphaerae bacterium]|nr:hypothetical protein [Phycisphaerae bacterium]HRR86841.1 hypothetical protein [Phycisphaerae bacterium]
MAGPSQTPVDASGWHSPTAILREALRNRGFVACVAMLALFAGGFQLLAAVRGFIFVKQRVDLKTPLNLLKQERLAPYKLLQPIEIQSDILNQLGTDQYVHWILQVPEKPEQPASGRIFSLFVTYYTGLPDAVPHAPEACYAGGGHKLIKQTPDEVTITSQGQQIVVPVQVLEFEKESQFGRNSRIVLYTFHANGQFRPDRTAVRLAIGSLTDRYAYFSKVEVGVDLDGRQFTKEQAVALAKEFLRVAMPVLLEDHWPDWEAVNRRSATQPTAGNGR